MARDAPRVVTRRRALAATAAAVAATAGCTGTDSVSEADTATSDRTTLSVQVTNRLTDETLSIVGGFPSEGVDVTVEVARVDQESLAETTVFEQSATLGETENVEWNDAVTIDPSADEYVLKGSGLSRFSMDDGAYVDDILRFTPDEIDQKVGETLDVWLGKVDGQLNKKAGLLVEPDEKQLA